MYRRCMRSRCVGTLLTTPEECAALLVLLTMLSGGSTFAQATAQQSEPAPSSQNPFAKAFSDAKAKLSSDLLGKVQLKPGAVNFFDTKLNNLLGKNPSTTSAFPEWPRIAISNVELPATALTHVPIGGSFKIKPGDCMYFKATIWADEKNSETLDSVAVCGIDIGRHPDLEANNQYKTSTDVMWPASGGTTGATRTEGPTPPEYFIDDQLAQRELDFRTRRSVLPMVGFLQNAVGYNKRFDQRRMWLVNFSNVN
jgi:hypothetical protein